MNQPCPILHTSVMNRSILAKYSSSQSHFPVKCEHKFSDAQFVAGAGMDGILRVRDVKSRQVQRTFDKPAHKVAVTSLAFSLRGKATACGSVDGKLILCNAVTGQGCRLHLTGQSTGCSSVIIVRICWRQPATIVRCACGIQALKVSSVVLRRLPVDTQ